MIQELGRQHSILNRFLAEIRDAEIQKDRMRFRRNLERIGEVMAYEISKRLPETTLDVTTPLGEANMVVPDGSPILATILRAGLPFHQGFLNYFDASDNAFVSAYRRYHKGGEFEIEVEYVSCPTIEGKDVIIIDPMLATGSSVECVYKALRAFGTPRHVHIAAVIASNQGVNYVRKQLPENITIWAAAIDHELTAQAYIVPGLGDAGDLAFGSKEH
ncbi:MAG: uracil phosphoribosyltransferase [Bacteroidota bacterium]